MKVLLNEEQYLNLLMEAKDPHEIYNEYYSDIKYDDFYKIVKADPKTKEKGGDLKKIGKYAKILLDIYRDEGLRFEDLDKAHDYLKIAYEHNIPLPKEKIGSISDIYGFVKHKIAEETYDLDTLLSLVDNDEYEVVYNGEGWMIFTPLTEKASCKLGAGTEWCTAHGEHAVDKDKQGRENAFEGYGDDLYIFINKNEPSEKYQLYLDEGDPFWDTDSSMEFRDVNDDSVNIKEVLKKIDNPSQVVKLLIPNLKEIDNIDNWDVDSIREILMFMLRISPEEVQEKILQEINENTNSELLTLLYKGLADSDVLSDIENKFIDDSGIEDINISEDSDRDGIEAIQLKLDEDELHNVLSSENAERLKLTAIISGLGNQKNVPYKLLNNDPVIENIEKYIDQLIEELIKHQYNDHSMDVRSLEEELRNIKDNLYYYIKKDTQTVLGQYIETIIQSARTSSARLANRMESIDVEVDYECFLQNVRKNDLKGIDANTFVNIYFDCESHMKLFDSLNEFYGQKESFRKKNLSATNELAKNNPELKGLNQTIKYIQKKAEEIVSNEKVTEETRKINRLIFHD